MAKEKKIHLPDLPQDEYYEDLVAALLCAGGYYIEKRIDLREPTNVLELDVVTSKYYPDHVDKTLSEIKSAGWWRKRSMSTHSERSNPPTCEQKIGLKSAEKTEHIRSLFRSFHVYCM